MPTLTPTGSSRGGSGSGSGSGEGSGGGLSGGESNSTPPPIATLTLNLKLKFQGIIKKPADPLNSMDVKTTLADGNLTECLVKVSNFSADNKGIWSVSVDFNAPAGTGYTIYIKGPKHIQKKDL